MSYSSALVSSFSADIEFQWFDIEFQCSDIEFQRSDVRFERSDLRLQRLMSRSSANDVNSGVNVDIAANGVNSGANDVG